MGLGMIYKTCPSCNGSGLMEQEVTIVAVKEGDETEICLIDVSPEMEKQLKKLDEKPKNNQGRNSHGKKGK